MRQGWGGPTLNTKRGRVDSVPKQKQKFSKKIDDVAKNKDNMEYYSGCREQDIGLVTAYLLVKVSNQESWKSRCLCTWFLKYWRAVLFGTLFTVSCGLLRQQKRIGKNYKNRNQSVGARPIRLFNNSSFSWNTLQSQWNQRKNFQFKERSMWCTKAVVEICL